MYPVRYHRVSSIEEALEIAKECDDPKFLSGGQTLIPTMKSRLAAPSDLIDLSRIAELGGIVVSGRTITVGAAVTHAEIASDRKLADICPAVGQLAGTIGDPHVRHMGTIGGSVANNDPAADYPAALLALNATIVTSKREIAAGDFFTGLFETALDEDEIVTSIGFVAPDRAGYAKFPNPASRYAMVGVFVAKAADGVRVAITGAGENGVFRATSVEAALAKRFDPAALENLHIPAEGLMSDIHASAQYRAHLVTVMARRAVLAAIAA